MTSSCRSSASWGGAALLGLGSGVGFSLAVELVDGVSPLRQPVVLGVECAQVVDVPQQVGPAALLGAIIMVVGSVEIADQHASKLVTVQTW